LQGLEEEHSDTCLSYRRKRRSDEELVKDEICPFVGCDKTYSSKSSLKLHMKRNHKDTDMIKEDYHKTFPVMNQFKKGVDLNRIFKKADIPEIARKALKNTKFSGRYYEEITNSSTIYTSASTAFPNNNKVKDAENWFFPGEYHDDDDLLSNNPQFFPNNEEDLWSDSMIAKNLEETIESVQKEINCLEKRDLNCLFGDEQEDDEFGSKFLRVECSGPNFGFCISEKSPAFVRVPGNGMKNPKTFNSGISTGFNFFEDECLSFSDDDESSSPIHKVGSKRNLGCIAANEIF